ncbi:MAG: hypothetical protein IPI81_02325 [Flavobacteriales bacterium]|nr:hypothetical protein [Flavobacteriales bacterium]MCC6936905.1 hypothetical protein [Flavobacteriales bacterium]
MKQVERRLPLSTVTLVFGALSIPLAFARHLCSLAVILGVYALIFGWWGQRRAAGHLLRYTAVSVKHSRIGARLAMVGTVCAVIMWVLWASNWLLT